VHSDCDIDGRFGEREAEFAIPRHNARHGRVGAGDIPVTGLADASESATIMGALG